MIHLLAAQYGTVSDIEILFFLIAFFGACFSLFNLRESWRDLCYLKERKIGNGRRLIAFSSFRAEIARLIIQAIYMTIAVLAMTFPDPPSNLSNVPFKVTLYRFVFTWGFIIAASLLSLKSFWNWSLRKTLLSEGLRDNDPAPTEDAKANGK